MMGVIMLLMKNKILQEIDLIPEDKLAELYDFVHQFRLELNKAPKAKNRSTMSFAGCWNDMQSELFDEFMKETEERRKRE